MKNFSWSTGNTKLKKLRTLGFSIPAFKSESGFCTCPAAGACIKWCYANKKQGRAGIGYVARAWERNLTVVRWCLELQSLATRLDEDLYCSRKPVRIHVAGDFFDQDYLDAWARVARWQAPKLFYAYTKMFARLDFTKVPENMRIIQSMGGQDDSKIDFTKPHSVIFASHKARRAAGYVNGADTDQAAMDGKIKIGLVYHGNANLTEVAAKQLTRALPIIPGD
jgi:hypothetical protein